AAVDSGDANTAFSQALSTASPARSSMQDRAGKPAVAEATDRTSPEAPRGPYPRMVAATAMPTASRVMTVSAPFATDFSARNSVIMTTIPKKAAAASVTHIGKAGERQM